MAWKKDSEGFEAMREQKRADMRTRWADPVWRAKMAKRKPHSPETRALMSAGQTAAHARKPLGVCDICHELKPLNQDHDHVTGKQRGKLCMNCNTAIGHLKDNPKILRDAVDYLERWS